MTTAVRHLAPRRTVAAAAALLALLATLLAPSPALADAGAEAAFVAHVNRERAAHGLPALAVAGDLTSVARQWSAHMASTEHLEHNPNLTSQVAGWQKVGENVGRGPDVDAIHAAFMASPGHRQNILDGDWTEVGIGVTVRDGRIWVTEVFRQPEAAPAPAPEPAPAPAPAPEAPAPAGAAAPAAEEPPADAPSPDTTAADADGPAPAPEPTPEAPADDRALVVLTRVAAEDAALDAA